MLLPSAWSSVISEARAVVFLVCFFFAGEENGIIKEIREFPISEHTFE